MVTATPTKLAELYRIDETAWLEAMAELIRSSRLDEVDYPNLNGSRAAYCETTQ